jgi:hypothetical protein
MPAHNTCINNNKITQSGIRVKTIKEVDVRVLDNLEETLKKGFNNVDGFWVL